VCTECGDHEPRDIIPNRVLDSIAARYSIRASYVGQLKYLLQELDKPGFAE
jgi:hypothetical protein